MAIWSENKILNRIVTTLNAAGFTAHNKFGDEISLDVILQQINNIYCFMEGCDYTAESNETIRGLIFFQFWVIDQALGASATKEDYTADTFRSYLASLYWKSLGITTDYPNNDFEPFILESERTLIHEETKNKITIFRGSIGFMTRMSS